MGMTPPDMTPLKERLIRQIAATGPMTVADYMTACLADPKDGYYTQGSPFGADGDFITAPDISQMFGELIGVWCLKAWIDSGAPANFNLVELGPGRGTLMADLLRSAAIRPDFLSAASLHMVEMSPKLRKEQAKALAGGPLQPIWCDTLADVPDGPMFLVANEFFDALPIHQYQCTPDGWQERLVGLSEDGGLCFGLGPGKVPPDHLPASLSSAAQGSIFEIGLHSIQVAAEIGARLKKSGGAALIIDYGHAASAAGDTLQAMARHAYDDVFAQPGKADLTAHVDFEALSRAAIKAGANAAPIMEQGDFLLALGLLERAGRLGTDKSPATQEQIRNDVERLAAPDQMGQLFKVLGLVGGRDPLFPFESHSAG